MNRSPSPSPSLVIYCYCWQGFRVDAYEAAIAFAYVADVVASAVVATTAIVVAAAFVATIVVAALYAANLVGFATSADANVDAIDLDDTASGVFTVVAKPNVTDD